MDGVYDEFSGFSILIRKEEGKTITEVAEPWLKIANDMFYKMRWMTKDAKPNGRAYLYDSLAAVAKKMLGSGNDAVDVMQVLEAQSKGRNELYTIPTINGSPAGGGTNPNYTIVNGLDPSVSQLWAANRLGSR